MAARNGKIANLPIDIREQLNLRFLEGETGGELAAWLNALPAVQSILGSQFNGSPVSEVNLTHWRQGGYLQWVTERECFDSARALADGDSNLAETGFSAERLLNVLTLRIGQLLTRWDFSSDETGSERAFYELARKARILQGISRSVLAIHRIQSRSTGEKSENARLSSNLPAKPNENAHASVAIAGGLVPRSREKKSGPSGDANCEVVVPQSRERQPSRSDSPPFAAPTVHVSSSTQSAEANGEAPFRQAQGPELVEGLAGGLETAQPFRKILSGPIIPSSIPSNSSHFPTNLDSDLAEILDAF